MATDFAYVTSGDIQITKTSSVDANTPLYPGDQFTYEVIARDPTGGTTLTGVSLYDAMPLGVAYVPGSAVATCEVPRNVRDEFASSAYTLNGPNNTDTWAGNWTETDALGGGAATGTVSVTGTQLVLRPAANVRDVFGSAAYNLNAGSANWAGNWTETDRITTATVGPGQGYAWITGGAFQFRYLASNVRDNFGTVGSYAANNGNVSWDAPWTETNDNNSAATGAILVNGQARFSTGTANRSISRTVTVTGATTATISFLPTDNGIVGGETLVAEYSIDGGAYQNIGTYDGGTAGWNNVTQSLVVGLSGTNDTLTVRFRAPQTWAGTRAARIDTVDIAFSAIVGTAIQRTANLATAAVATLTFTTTAAGLAAGDTVIVEASSDGATFTTLDTFDGASGAGVARSYDITSFASANTTIRFTVTSGLATAGDSFSIDNVDIAFRRPTEIQRTANLTGTWLPWLTFTVATANLEASDTLEVQASAAAGGPFTTLATFSGATPSLPQPYDLTPFISATTTIRFQVTGGYQATDETFTIDNVDITYGVLTALTAGTPPNFLEAGSGCRAYHLTFDVIVDSPLASGIDTITNTAATTSIQYPIQLTASATNLVVNPSTLSANVSGRVWFDANFNGVQDLGEAGIPNVEVTLKDRFGTPVATLTQRLQWSLSLPWRHTGHRLLRGGNGRPARWRIADIPGRAHGQSDNLVPSRGRTDVLHSRPRLPLGDELRRHRRPRLGGRRRRPRARPRRSWSGRCAGDALPRCQQRRASRRGRRAQHRIRNQCT